MKLIISPAKKMRTDTDSLQWQDFPQFLEQAHFIRQQLLSMTYAQLKALWKCNDQIARQNMERLQDMDLTARLTPAILSYDGIQYKYMAPGVFTDQQYAYVQDKLRILSGFYGILKPFDGVTPYRLEMQAKLELNGCRDLYDFWSDKLAKALYADTDCIVNLASREYSKCISDHLQQGQELITCVFAQPVNGKWAEKGTLCKMARGEMVRYLAENSIENPMDVRSFDRLGYCWNSEASCADKFVFYKYATDS